MRSFYPLISAIACALLLPSAAGAQTFYRSYLTSGPGIYSPFRDVTATPDSGMAFVADEAIQKLDKNGHTVWAMSLTPPVLESPSPQSFVQSSTGAYFIFGVANATFGSNDSTWVAKVSGDGSAVFTVVYHMFLWQLCPTPDAGYIMLGSVNDGAGHYYNAITRCDSAGSIVWAKQYSTDSSIGGVYSIVPSHTAGNFVIMANGVGGGGAMAECFEIDGTGNIVWQKKYHTTIPNSYIGFKLISHPDGYVIASQPPADSTYFGYDIDLLKIDTSGNPLWANQYSDPDNAMALHGLAANSAGNILVTGIEQTTTDFGYNLYFLIDKDGNIAWGKKSNGIGGTDSTLGLGPVVAIYNGNFFCGGYSIGAWRSAALIDNYGYAFCDDSNKLIIQTSMPITVTPTTGSASTLSVPSGSITTVPVSPVTITEVDYCSTAAVQQVETRSAVLSIYPNPANNVFTVHPANTEWQSVSVTGIDGRIWQTVAVNSSAQADINIDVHAIPAGIYLVSVTYHDGKKEIARMSVVH